MSIMSRERWLLIAKLAVTILLLAVILWRVPLDVLVGSLYNLRPWPLVAAIALTPAIQALKIAKWHYVAHQAQPTLSYRSAAVSLLVGVAVGLITPGRSGELTRVLYLDTERKAEFLSLVVADKMLDLFIIVLFAGISVWLLAGPQYGLILLAGAMLLGTSLGISRVLTRWMHETQRSIPGKERLEQLLGQLRVLHPGVIVSGLVLSALTFCLALVQFYWLLTAFEPVPLESAIVSFPLLLLAGVVPITVAGIGIREGTAALVLASYGVAEAVAIDATFLSFALNTLIPGIVGALLIAVTKRPKAIEQSDFLHKEQL
jgi:uncharacterized membrane protein YbhN (UPF0104 family)